MDSENACNNKEQLLFILPFAEPVAVVQRIQHRFPSFVIRWKRLDYGTTTWDETEKLDEDIYKDASILCTLSALPKPSQAPNLKMIQLLPAGVDHLFHEPIYTDTAISIATTSGIHAPQIAEWVILNILALTHHFRTTLTWQQQRHWGTHKELHEVAGPLNDVIKSRVGILGYGSIGRQVARVCKAMGMDILAFTASSRTSPDSRRDEGFCLPNTGDPEGNIPIEWFSGLDKTSLHNFLNQDIDILVVTIPLTPLTKHLLGEEEFAILGKARKNGQRPGALVLNVARGAIIEQTALIQALRRPVAEGGLRGAALDVTDPEPLPEDHELWSVPNAIISPHCSGVNSKHLDRFFQVLEENLARYEKGDELLNLVVRKNGY